jgi:hypothetical protein
MGIKEVPPEFLIAGKTYFFFSHTIKKQPYNRSILQQVLQKNIRLVDYECLIWENGSRVIGFGRFAGIIGTHNGLWAWGEKFGTHRLKRAFECFDYQELLELYKNISLPAIKIALCGDGRVAHGSMELMEKAGIREVTNRAYIQQDFSHPVYVHLRQEHLYESRDHVPFDKSYFYHNPEDYFSVFNQYYPVTDLMINAVYWNERIPLHFTLEEMKSDKFNIKVIADITCDINGSVPSTVKACAIGEAVYGWNAEKKTIEPPFGESTIEMMTIGNLPCELPRDSSEEFGSLLVKHILPAILVEDSEGILERGTIAKDGTLSPRFSYLKDYAAPDA